MISKRFEIGTDQDHVHFLIQSVSTTNPIQIIRTVRSLTPKVFFKRHSEVKQKLWGGEFLTKGYDVITVCKHGDEKMIQQYVKPQGTGKEYKKLHEERLRLF